MGGKDGEGDVTGCRQLLGHCLPGVCTSVISEKLFSLATYRHTHFLRAPPSSSPVSPSTSSMQDSGEQVRFIQAQALYIDTVTSCQHLKAASLSVFDG